MGVEPFVDAEWDTELLRPLLDLLGVRSTPSGPDRLLDALRALADAEAPPWAEVEKWYRRLDQYLETAGTDEVSKIRAAFTSERLVACEDDSWATAGMAYQKASDEDVPGAPIVRSSVRDLSIWRRLGVAEWPTPDLAVGWLKGTEHGTPLNSQDVLRVQAILKRHGVRVWQECEAWLNLSAEWVSISSARYALRSQSVAWTHLHQHVKRVTLDLRGIDLPRQVFSNLIALEASLDERLSGEPSIVPTTTDYAWLRAIGSGLSQINLSDRGKAENVRSLGRRLSQTRWETTKGLKTLPYLDGQPAGTARSAEARWIGTTLYVESGPLVKLARATCSELDRHFQLPELADTFKMCFDRPPSFVDAFLADNFDLAVGSSDVDIDARLAPSQPGPQDGSHAPATTVEQRGGVEAR